MGYTVIDKNNSSSSSETVCKNRPIRFCEYKTITNGKTESAIISGRLKITSEGSYSDVERDEYNGFAYNFKLILAHIYSDVNLIGKLRVTNATDGLLLGENQFSLFRASTNLVHNNEDLTDIVITHIDSLLRSIGSLPSDENVYIQLDCSLLESQLSTVAELCVLHLREV